ncbi:hypothetical protein ABIE58_001378 [Roseovarius sp. MBR-78]|jgi:hypothetical protein|uniref:hypothetical protein n=1 Tax=Roseovarius sp. MBR-78 TaxID=3156460 RepID=UPI003394C630
MIAGRAYRLLGAALLGVALVAGCTDREDRVYFDGNYYPGKVRGEKADRRVFTATARRAGRGIEGAQKAAVYEATRYCIMNFGTSEIAWAGVAEGQTGPVYARSGDRVSVTGRCVIWE